MWNDFIERLSWMLWNKKARLRSKRELGSEVYGCKCWRREACYYLVLTYQKECEKLFKGLKDVR